MARAGTVAGVGPKGRRGFYFLFSGGQPYNNKNRLIIPPQRGLSTENKNKLFLYVLRVFAVK
jgi:hypothetical protein